MDVYHKSGAQELKKKKKQEKRSSEYWRTLESVGFQIILKNNHAKIPV